ncbi:alpha/beta fold hydrolase [Streptomyces sp. NPDC048504]|uniref:alpha/beta fold hydrolase n=1 Tax=Streptomyces sp. NPDC048504 TaxID=3365559 RepID=UPI00371698E4
MGWFSSSPASAARLGSEASTPARPKVLGSFESLKRVRAGELDIEYAEVGPAKGPVVVLPHGWPYDIHSYVDVAPPPRGSG